METNQPTAAAAAAAEGKQILLGKVFTEITFPKRMPMTAELRFIEMYQSLVARVKESKMEIFGKIREFMNGQKSVDFGLVEGLDMVGQLFGQLSSFQDGLVDALMIIVEAQKSDIKADEIHSDLSTADCLEILAAQSEVQGLLGSFRGILAGLSSQSRV